MNVEKHESSLLKVVSDVGSTPTASTILKLLIYSLHDRCILLALYRQSLKSCSKDLGSIL